VDQSQACSSALRGPPRARTRGARPGEARPSPLTGALTNGERRALGERSISTGWTTLDRHEWGELRTNYGPRRPNSAHLNGQRWTPAISGSGSTTVEARSGGQGVASSNLASPTEEALVRADCRAVGDSPRPRIRHRFSNISGPTGQSGSESTGSGPRSLRGGPQIGADIDINRVPRQGSGVHWCHARSIHSPASVCRTRWR
jgi:hypothetical protein